MKTTTKRILVIAAALIAAGILFTGLGLFLGGRPGIAITSSGIRSASYNPEPYSLQKTKLDSFDSVSMVVNSYADIQILPSGDENYYLEYNLDGTYEKPFYEINNHTLTFSQDGTNSVIQTLGFFEYGFSSSDPYVILYIPQDKSINTLELYNDSGDVDIEKVNAGNAELSVDYGDLYIKDTEFKALSLTLNSGDLEMEDTKAHSLELYNDYGDATLKNFDCGTAQITMDSGDLSVDAARLESLDCTNNYGEVSVRLPEKLDTYAFDLSADYGDIHIPSDALQGFYSSSGDMEQDYKTEGNGKYKITVYCDSGDIEIQER